MGRIIKRKTLQKIKKYLYKVGSKRPVLLKYLRKIIFLRRKALYKRWVGSIKVDEKMILFSCYRGRIYGCSPKAIYQEILRDPRFSDYKLIWVYKKVSEYRDHPEMERAHLVRYGTKQFYTLLGTAKYWVVNIRVPEHIYVKPEQVYIQTWHGTPLKRLGCDLKYTTNAQWSETDIFKQYNRDGLLATYFISPSPYTTEKLISAFNLKENNREDIVVETGYPRNDILRTHTEADVLAIKERLDIPKDKKAILYTPTWRDNQHESGVGYTYSLQTDFDTLRESLDNDYIVLFRAHYLVANNFDFQKYEGFIYDVSGVDDINDLYIASDMLITDYSSTFFDYSNLFKPIIFYMYDLNEYQNEIRGFYLDLSELPGPIIETENELVSAIKNVADNDPRSDEKYIKFRERFVPLDDGLASKRVIESMILA